MQKEISNKTLAFLLIGAIAVSLFGTFVSLHRLNQLQPGLQGITGMATNGTGTVQLDVQGQASFMLNAGTVNFGEITPNSTGFWISTETNNSWANATGNTNTCVLTGGSCAGIEIENDGNEVINISFNTTTDAPGLIGGSGITYFAFRVVNGSRAGADDGCNGTITYSAYQNITANTPYQLCTGAPGSGLGYIAGADKITMEFNLSIPNDAVQGATSANIELWNLP